MKPIRSQIRSPAWVYRAALVCAALMLPGVDAAALLGQDIQLGVQPGPYYVGEPVVIQIVARGLERDDQPTCRLQGDPPAGITLQGQQVGQSSQSFYSNINGRVTVKESVDYRFSFVVTADRAGQYTVGPFEVTYGGTSREVEGASFQFAALQDDPDMQVELSLPRSDFYIGEEVPLTIRWSFEADDWPVIQYAFSKLEIRSPLFDQFTFKQPSRRSDTALVISTAKGDVSVPAEATRRDRTGRQEVVVTGSLTLVLDAVGEYDAIPVTCRTKKVTRWSRSLFGDLTARSDAPSFATGTPLSFSVKPIPLEGRPASFAGAVGRGFSLDVSANRSMVRVGDPIALTLTLRGDGNLERISLPALGEQVGLPTDLFQVPAEEVAGTYDGQAKQFKVNVRVKDSRVTQIPPLAFSWFDPTQGRFQTTQSKPIALQVAEAHVVSAANVVSAAPAGSPGVPPGSTAANSAESASDSSAALAFVGANLAIERDVGRLLTDTASRISPRAAAVVVYLLSALVLVGGVVLRRRAQADTESLRKKKRLKALRRQLGSVPHHTPRDSAELIARTLRELVAQHHLRRRADAERVIAVCETIIYATDQADVSRIAELAQQARTLIEDATEES